MINGQFLLGGVYEDYKSDLRQITNTNRRLRLVFGF